MDQRPDGAVNALGLHIGHVIQALQQVVAAHIGDILADGRQGQDHPGVIRDLGPVQTLILVSVLLHIVDHIVIVPGGHGAAAAGQADDHPFAAGGVHRGGSQGGHVVAGGLVDDVQALAYAKYIATRPRAERLGSHGLFGDADHVSLDTAMDELSHYTGNVWTHIISLKREDAMRLGYDHAAAWRTLLRAHRNDIAAAMNIDPRDFRWYAAFHNEGNHPHVHMMAWSATPGQAYLDRDGIRQIKSTLTNQIFQQELLHLYEEESVSRDELVHQTRQAMLELAQRMRDGLCICPTAEQKLWELSQKLDDVQGKKVYGYLPKSLKQLTDDTVDAMAKLPTVNKCYQKWWELQCQLNDYYSEQQRQRPPLSQQKEFRQIKNAVIKEAEHIRQGHMSFEDAALAQEDEPVDDRSMSYDCWELRKIIANESIPLEERDKVTGELEQIANQGDPHAQYIIGLLYRDGGLLVPDTEQANTGWSCPRRNCPMPNTLWESYTSRMIPIYTTLRKVSSGCNGRRTAGTSTPPTV